jgi:hypothetical protein
MSMKMQKAQSAMEYLMTYGWAILIIAVVLASLFALGVFNSGASLSTSCIALAGFTCSSPVLHQGNLSVSTGQATGQTWTNTVLYFDPTGTTGCTSTITNSSLSSLGSGGSGVVKFFGSGSAYLPVAVGSSASGTIWAGYDTPAVSGLCVQMASLSLKAT